MQFRLCKHCGEDHDFAYRFSKCRKCREYLDEQKCNTCKEIKLNDQFYRYKNGKAKGYYNLRCKSCNVIRSRKFDKENPEKRRVIAARHYEKYTKLRAEQFEDWQALTEERFKMLTEKQWLEACIHFEGCAICGEEHIEARDFFVPYKDGGRYTAWNVFPVCGKCALHARTNPNPFSFLKVGAELAIKLGLNKERADKLKAYMKQRLQEEPNG